MTLPLSDPDAFARQRVGHIAAPAVEGDEPALADLRDQAFYDELEGQDDVDDVEVSQSGSHRRDLTDRGLAHD